MKLIDVTTTSVGRILIKETYQSFFEHVHFSGKFNFHITIDPAYGVDEAEIEEVLAFLQEIRSDPRVNEVEITRFDTAVGLENALLVLLSQCHQRYGINLEDDWRFFAGVDIDAMIAAMQEQQSCMIAFSSTHLQMRGTFLPQNGAQHLSAGGRGYIKLVPPNWACDYIPLAPNVHDNYIWNTAYIIGLAYDSNRERCPDERTKEYVRSHGLREKYNVLWTEEIVVEDTGRRWLSERKRSKQILPGSMESSIEMTSPYAQALFDNKGYIRSEYMYQRAIQTIPGQTQTFMKRGGEHLGRRPLYADKGIGCRFFDVDGNCYIDYVAGLGVLQLGFCHPAFKEAVLAHLSKGVYFSLPAWHEVEASELLCSVIPNADMVRFLKSGGDACSAAVTLARYITGKNGILSCGYHGWHEQFQPQQPGALPELSKWFCEFELGKDSVETIMQKNPGKFACVIAALPYEAPVAREALMELRAACDRHNVLLILDDIVMGFRLALGGSQAYYEFDADIVLLSKAMTAGAELAAVCGKREYMKAFEKLYVSTTMGGELTAFQCLINAVTIYKTTDLLARSHQLGAYLQDCVNESARQTLGYPLLQGYACMPYLKSPSVVLDHKISDQLIANGIYMRPGCNFVTCAHEKRDIDITYEVFKKILNENAEAWRNEEIDYLRR